MEDLSLVTTDAMFNELRKRFDALLLIGSVNKTSDKGSIYMQYIGEYTNTLFLANYAGATIMGDFVHRAIPEDPEDIED